MQRLKFAAAALYLAAVAGCDPPQQRVMLPPFDPSEIAGWTAAGSANLLGQAFLKTVGGDVKTCAGRDVAIMPDTQYYRSLLSVLRSHAEPVNLSKQAMRVEWHTLCDAQGNFSFEGLRPGGWIILTTVEWGVPGEYGVNEQGGGLAQQVNLQPGNNKAILTGRDEL